ncbi:MAG: hypothetical protein R2741_15505 [Methanolobus sp.]
MNLGEIFPDHRNWPASGIFIQKTRSLPLEFVLIHGFTNLMLFWYNTTPRYGFWNNQYLRKIEQIHKVRHQLFAASNTFCIKWRKPLIQIIGIFQLKKSSKIWGNAVKNLKTEYLMILSEMTAS